MNKKDLAEKVSLTPATIAKMGKGGFVSMEILYRSRQKKLNSDFVDMVSIINGEESKSHE